jgi:hypothetical protein
MTDMSRGARRAAAKAAERAHKNARALASLAIDSRLGPADAAWLDKHLIGCADCQAAANDYRAIHDEFRGLGAPEPPRDLWARTSAALDSVDRAGAGRGRGFGRTGLAGLNLGSLARNRISLVAAMAAAVVVLVVGTSFLSHGTLFSPAAAPSHTTNVAIASAAATGGTQNALAVVGGTSYWVAPENGIYQIKGGAAHCTGSPENCAVTNGQGVVLGSVASKTAVSVVISPNATRAAVWNATKIVILPLTDNSPKTVAIDLLTPQPVASPVATQPPATPAATDSTTPNATDAAGATISATEQPVATAAAATPAPPAATAASASGTQAAAILDGYQIVGRAPEFSANGQWVAFSARPSNVGSGSDVFIWRVGWARAQAVTAGHADLFAGWLGARILISEFAASSSAASATPIAPAAASETTADATNAPATDSPAPGASAADATPPPAPVLGGQTGPDAISYVYDPLTSAVWEISRPMLMPVVDPTGRYVVYWSGSLAFDQTTGLYGPGRGDFYFDGWSHLNLVSAHLGGEGGLSATPAPTIAPTEAPTAAAQPSDSASPLALADGAFVARVASPAGMPPLVVAQSSSSLPERVPVDSIPGAVTSWSVRWDATGQFVAIWVADAGPTDVGNVTLFGVTPGTDLLNVDIPLLSAPARSTIQFDDASFVYTSPAGGGMTHLLQLPALQPAPTAPAATPPPAGVGPGQSDATQSQSASTSSPAS